MKVMPSLRIHNKKSLKSIFFALLFFLNAIHLSANCAFASEEILKGSVLSVDDCVNIALQNSPKVNIAKNNTLITKSRIGQAKSDYFPRVGLSGGYFGNNTKNDNFTNNSDYYNASVGLTQLIYNFGKTSAGIRMQQFYDIASRFDLDYIILDTVYNTKNSYYGVLSAKAKKEVADANVEINKRQYEQIEAFYEEGLKSRIDFINAQVNLSNSKIEKVVAESNYENAVVKLNNAMYVTYAPSYAIKNTESFNLKDDWTDVKFLNIANYKKLEKEISSQIDSQTFSASLTSKIEKTDFLEDFVFRPYAYTFEQALEIAKDQRPDLRSYAATRDAMKESLKLAKKEYFPELNVNAGYAWKNADNYSSNGFNYSTSLDISAVNAMDVKYKVNEAEAQLDIAQQNLDLIDKNIYFEVQNAFINMIQLEKQIPLMETRVTQARENFLLADGRYGTGLGNFIELQDSRSKYLSAQQEYIQTIYNYNVARTTLELAMGEK